MVGFKVNFEERLQLKLAYKNLQVEICHWNTQKYKNLFSPAKKNRFLYKKITPILTVKILDFNHEKPLNLREAIINFDITVLLDSSQIILIASKCIS